MALSVPDRLLTIVVTATLTSAAWLVAGGTWMERARIASGAGTQGGQPVAAGSQAQVAPTASAVAAASSARQELAQSLDLIVPVAGIRARDLSDTFTQSRGGGSRLHEAIDIMAPEGTPVVAAASGTIEKRFQSKQGGNTIYVRSPDRTTIHYYAHLRDYAAGLTEGQAVRAGQRLGTVGSTGNAGPSGPHLHFSILRTTPQAKWWEPATAVNPYPLLKAR